MDIFMYNIVSVSFHGEEIWVLHGDGEFARYFLVEAANFSDENLDKNFSNLSGQCEFRRSSSVRGEMCLGRGSREHFSVLLRKLASDLELCLKISRKTRSSGMMGTGGIGGSSYPLSEIGNKRASDARFWKGVGISSAVFVLLAIGSLVFIPTGSNSLSGSMPAPLAELYNGHSSLNDEKSQDEKLIPMIPQGYKVSPVVRVPVPTNNPHRNGSLSSNQGVQPGLPNAGGGPQPSFAEEKHTLDTLQKISAAVSSGKQIDPALIDSLPPDIAAKIKKAQSNSNYYRNNASGNGEFVPNSYIQNEAQKDVNGIPDVPDRMSWSAIGRPTIPYPGGGDIKSPSDMKAFGFQP